MPSAKEQVEIILCTYQSQPFLEEQLQSLGWQTYRNFRINIYDDCSTDNTIEVIQRFKSRFDSLSYFQNENRVGFLKNFERGLCESSAEYIALCDQDDIWSPDKLMVSMKHMKQLEKKYPARPLLVHSDLVMINDKGDEIQPSFFEFKSIYLDDKKSLGAMLGHCGVMGNTILINRALVKLALPFPTGIKYHDYWLALVNELFGIRKTINRPLVKYRIHQDNTSPNRAILFPGSSRKGPVFSRSFSLPFIGNRDPRICDYLLDYYSGIDPDDKEIIREFANYLRLKQSRLKSYLFLLFNGFLKKSIKNRLLVFLKIMLVDRSKLN